MSDPYIGEIRLFAFTRAPTNWLLCAGQTLDIASFQALFTLLGTEFGGDGITKFQLPDLQGRVPIGQGAGPNLPLYHFAQSGGDEAVALTTEQMPPHSHALLSTTNVANQSQPGPSVNFATSNPASRKIYVDAANVTAYDVMAQAITPAGKSQSHTNMMPCLVGNYCICYKGIFPPRS